MTGTGTQQDPFVIANWADFITAVGTANAYVEFPKQLTKTRDRDVNANKLYLNEYGIVQTNVQPSDLRNLYENTFILDANDYAPAGLSSTITVNCVSINGYGGYIKNLSSLIVNLITLAAQNTVISQIAFLNINAQDAYFIYETYSASYNKCLFSGRMSNDTNSLIKWFGNSGYHHSVFTSCSMNFEIHGKNMDLFNIGTNTDGAVLNFCRVEIHVTNGGGTGSAGHLYAQPINSYFTGDCDSYFEIGFTGGSEFSIYEIESPVSTIYLRGYGTIDHFLINTDKYSESVSSPFIGVDSETLSSAAALNAIGFLVQT